MNYLSSHPPPLMAPKPTAGIGPIVMVGKLHAEKNIFSGIWAMSKAELKQKGKNEPFELCSEIVKDKELWYPPKGLYEGYFYFQEARGRRKVSDSCYLTFVKNSIDGLNIEGYGQSDYGPYAVTGILEKSKNIVHHYPVTMWRIAVAEDSYEHLKKKLSSIPCLVKRSTPAEEESEEAEKKGNEPPAESCIQSAPAIENGNSKSCAKEEINIGSPSDGSENEDFDWMKISSNILDDLWHQPEAIRWFRRPVDPIRDSAPNYFQIISNPMDLGTIRAKINGQKYHSMEEFVEDCKLVFQNAVTYNVDPYSPPHKDALILMERMNSLLAEHVEIAYESSSTNYDGPSLPEKTKSSFANQKESDFETKKNEHAAQLLKMDDDEIDKLQKRINELFEKQESTRDRAYACVTWNLLLACVPKESRRVEDDYHIISLHMVPKIHQYQLAELMERWITGNDPVHGENGSEPAAVQSGTKDHINESASDDAELSRKRMRSQYDKTTESSKAVHLPASSEPEPYCMNAIQVSMKKEILESSTGPMISNRNPVAASASIDQSASLLEGQMKEPIVLPIIKDIIVDEPATDLGTSLDDWGIDANDYDADEPNGKIGNSDLDIARLEKAERERRERERAENEKTAQKAQEDAAAKQESETRRNMIEAKKRAEREQAHKEEMLKSEREARIVEEQNRMKLEKQREQKEADVNLDEIRQNTELMKMMNQMG